jgi:hypothetical protein
MSQLQELANYHAFAPISGLDRTEAEAANTRTFLGEGTEFLEVPGLLELHGVSTALMVFPMEETREFPTDASLKRLEIVTMPMFNIARTRDGKTYLRRNYCSNDGVWQFGERFAVSGVWDESVPEVKIEEEDPKKKMKKGLR